ncbi:MAG TPA: hypothetical protein VEV45_20865 [Streptosporangiaceae bacterium]|nr:hypothetical protein [Streptosporangiaceae bacterium]
MALRRSKQRGRKQERPAPLVPDLNSLKRADRARMRKLIDAELENIRSGKAKTPKPFRWRFQLVPVAWFAGALAGLVCHAAHSFMAAAVSAVLISAITIIATRAREPFPRRNTQAWALWTSLWITVLAVTGYGPWAGVYLLGWLAMAMRWWAHYAWRPKEPTVVAPPGDIEIWNDLAEVKKWFATLGPPRQISNGVVYPILCRGSRTHIDQIITERSALAAAYGKSIVEAYAEQAPDGRKDRGMLTLLRTNTLMEPRQWDGLGIDLATGLAVVGRFPEGGDVHERYFIRGSGRGGAKHTIIAGVDGSGKTGLIDLGLCISASSGIIAPVVLDPQEGQALPAWRDHVPYACGLDECMAYLRGLHDAMRARSQFLANSRWCPEHGIEEGRVCSRTGCRRRTRMGMHFFDPWMTGLPFIEITIDEAPILLAVKGSVPLLLDILKLGRKVGFRVRLAAQVPSMKELGGSSELRSILAGGSVFVLRTGDKVSGGMLNMPVKPWELPKQFPNGEPTFGLGYGDTPDGRNSVTIRTDWVADAFETAERLAPTIRQPNEDVLARLHNAVGLDQQRVAQLQGQAADMATAQLQVLAALRGPMRWGELIGAVPELQASEVVKAFGQLVKQGRAVRNGDVVEPVVLSDS